MLRYLNDVLNILCGIRMFCPSLRFYWDLRLLTWLWPPPPPAGRIRRWWQTMWASLDTLEMRHRDTETGGRTAGPPGLGHRFWFPHFLRASGRVALIRYGGTEGVNKEGEDGSPGPLAGPLNTIIVRGVARSRCIALSATASSASDRRCEVRDRFH